MFTIKSILGLYLKVWRYVCVQKYLQQLADGKIGSCKEMFISIIQSITDVPLTPPPMVYIFKPSFMTLHTQAFLPWRMADDLNLVQFLH